MCDVFSSVPKRNVRSVLDLGCGTGTLSLRLAERGFKVTGVDLSPDMLTVARDKCIFSGLDILLLNQDVCSFILPVRVDAVISTLDCFNYILNPDDLKRAFQLSYDNLETGGVFAFDIASEYKLSSMLGCNSFIFDEDSVFFTWECEYNPNDKTANQYMNFFMRNKGKTYTRECEMHKQRAYSVEDIVSLLFNAGFTGIEYYDGFSFNSIRDSSERIFFTAVK